MVDSFVVKVDFEIDSAVGSVVGTVCGCSVGSASVENSSEAAQMKLPAAKNQAEMKVEAQ